MRKWTGGGVQSLFAKVHPVASHTLTGGGAADHLLILILYLDAAELLHPFVTELLSHYGVRRPNHGRTQSPFHGLKQREEGELYQSNAMNFP